jgi:hypothetical protein
MKSTLRRTSAILSTVIAAMMLQGCFVGGMIENARRESTREVKAEYTGLEGKDFAVVVYADRIIQADNPKLVEFITEQMTKRLSSSLNTPRPSGFVASDSVLRYLYDNPGWNTKPMSELAKGLGGVKRLVYVELHSYQLRDPGNQYEWNAVASGNVSIVEIDSVAPDDFAFQRTVTVRFPDKKGLGPSDIPGSGVNTAVALRFVDRASWLFYDHDEPYYPDY